MTTSRALGADLGEALDRDLAADYVPVDAPDVAARRCCERRKPTVTRRRASRLNDWARGATSPASGS